MRFDHPEPRHIPGLRELWKACFGDGDAFLDDFFTLAYAPDRCLCALDGDTPVAMLYWLDCQAENRPLAYLYAIATAPAYRNLGLCRKLLKKALSCLQERGYSGAILVPDGENLFDFYQKSGFCHTIFKKMPEAPSDLTPVTALEYAAARRALLPPGGVVQEGPALDLLARYADFYRGEGGVVAKAREDGRILECLGIASEAPPQPWAMYCPLSPTPAPVYFAFALD